MPGCHGAAFSASGAQAEGPFREDGYFNMTKAAKHFGKHLPHFWALSETREYMCIIVNDLYSNSRDHDDLNADARAALHWYSVGSIRLMTHKEEAAIRALLVEASRGSGGGSWAHPKLAVFFARWLDVRFAVWCDMQIDDILHGRSAVVPAQQAQAPVVTLTMEQVNEAIRAAVAPLEQRIAGLLAAPVSVPPSVISVKNCLRSGAIPLQRICPAVHQKPAKATTTP